ncbi:MAG: VWA domain-containing protein [Acidimicrobiales bacterium]
MNTPAANPRAATSSAGINDLFTGVNRASFVAAFAKRLRSVGIAAPLSSSVRCAEALAAAGPITRDDLYWITRLSFISHRDQLPTFDALFDALFDTANDLRNLAKRGDSATSTGDEEHRRRTTAEGEATTGAGLPWATLPTIVDDGDTDDDDATSILVPERRPSDAAFDANRPFDLLDEAELLRVGRLLETMLEVPTRRSRRRRRSSTGRRPALRSTMRRARRTGGDPLRIDFTETTHGPRRIVVLVDVSGSMESFAQAYLHLTRALAVAGHAEVFAFATTLTRITPALRHGSAVTAIDRASDEVGDRFSGTRLATSLSMLLRHPRWGGFVRGAVVVIVSDGWDTDPPESLTRSMARLHRLAERVVWANPRLAAPGYEPLVASMAAALPYCDAFVSGHSPAALDELVATIGRRQAQRQSSRVNSVTKVTMDHRR